MSLGRADNAALLVELDDYLQGRRELQGADLEGMHRRACSSGSGESLVKLGALIEKARPMLGRSHFRYLNRSEPQGKPSSPDSAGSERWEWFNKAKSAYSLARDKGHADAAFRLGRLLYSGFESEPYERVYYEESALPYLEEAAQNGHVDALVWVANIHVEFNRPVMDKQRARRLYETAAAGGSLAAVYNLAAILSTTERNDSYRGYLWNEERLWVYVDGELEGITWHKMTGETPESERSKQLLLDAAARGHSHAMCLLGFIFQHGHLGEPRDLRRAAAWYSRARDAGHAYVKKKFDGSMAGVVPDFSGLPVAAAAPAQLQLLQQEVAPLLMALHVALASPARLTEQYLCDTIQARHVTSAAALFAGHNLVLLAMRSGVVTRASLQSVGGSPWFLRDNLYAPAVKLVDGDTALINAVFMHAEAVAIIPDGYCLKLARDILVDTNDVFKQANKVLNDVYLRMNQVESRVNALEEHASGVSGIIHKLCTDVNKLQVAQIETQKAVQNLGDSLTNLHSLLRQQRKREMYAGVSSLVFSLIPFVGGLLGTSANTATSFLGLTAMDMVETGAAAGSSAVSAMISVDVSNFSVARTAFSPTALFKLSPENRRQLEAGVKKGGFTNCAEVEQLLSKQVQRNSSDKTVAYFLDMQSKEWESPPTQGEASSVGDESAKTEKAHKMFQAHAHGKTNNLLNFEKAAEVLNSLMSDFNLGEISEEEFEEMVYAVHEDSDMVSEDIFMKIFTRVNGEKEAASQLSVVKHRAETHFADRTGVKAAVKPDKAWRMLKSFLKSIATEKIIPQDPVGADNDLAREAISKFEHDEDGMITRAAFVDGVCAIISKII